MLKAEIKKSIIKEISSHRLGAVLYIEIFNFICRLKSPNPISEKILYEILFEMIKSKELDLIIPDPFLIKWEKKKLKNLSYLQDNDYYVRNFHYINDKLINNSNKNQPLIDTRNLIKDNSGKIELIAEKFINIISKFPRIKEKVIFSLPIKSPSIKLHFIDNIFEREKLEEKSFDTQIKKVDIKNDKIEIKLKEQEDAIELIKKYREKYMCVYITLIETIQKELSYLEKYKSKIDNYEEIYSDILESFKKYSILFAEEAWTEDSITVQKGIAIKTGKLYYTSVVFKEGFFFIKGKQEYWALFDKKRFPGLLNFLLKLGYEEMGIDKKNDLNRVGSKLTLEFPISNVEQLFFLCKYIFMANLFHLLFLINLFFKVNGDLLKLNKKSDNLSEIFLPILKPLFNINQVKPVKKITFAFPDANKDEINIIFHRFLFFNSRKVEQKLRFFQSLYKRKLEKAR